MQFLHTHNQLTPDLKTYTDPLSLIRYILNLAPCTLKSYFKISSSFFSNASPLKFLAMITPLGSSNILNGIPKIPYCCEAAFSHPFISPTCGQVYLSSLTAFNH